MKNRISISGRIKCMDKENIYVEISEQYVAYLKSHCKEHYDIHFQINNLPYKIQHKALDYVQKFELHSLLIANEKYKKFDLIDRDHLCDHIFR